MTGQVKKHHSVKPTRTQMPFNTDFAAGKPMKMEWKASPGCFSQSPQVLCLADQGKML